MKNTKILFLLIAILLLANCTPAGSMNNGLNFRFLKQGTEAGIFVEYELFPNDIIVRYFYFSVYDDYKDSELSTNADFLRAEIRQGVWKAFSPAEILKKENIDIFEHLSYANIDFGDLKKVHNYEDIKWIYIQFGSSEYILYPYVTDCGEMRYDALGYGADMMFEIEKKLIFFDKIKNFREEMNEVYVMLSKRDPKEYSSAETCTIELKDIIKKIKSKGRF